MGIELYKHNAIAYDKVKKMFETENRACVVHPTGCGKSFIVLKWLEDNKDKKALFLAPTVTIINQISKHLEDCGLSIKDFPNLKMLTYSKLSRMTKKEIANINTDLIVLDEFHRCGADEWSKGVANLINNNFTAKVLGVSATPIRYLDEHRNMAEELFQGNVASEISLAQALVDDILPMPKYINAVYSFKEDIDRLQEKIDKEKSEERKSQAQQYLDNAKKFLENADGLPQIFAKHMTNKSGKYIVFCKDMNHMNLMMEEAKSWFEDINSNIDIFSVASFLPKKENTKTFDEFYNTNNDHLKLLFSVDMLNEGIHVPNIDGVIMLRPTSSLIIYQQQLGRALSVGHNKYPLVFDIVNNVQSCELISHFYKELRERALVKFTQTGKQSDKEKIDAFEISDTIRQIQDIFKRVDDFLSLSWDDYYNLAVEYYEVHGNLLVPSNYSKNGINLGIWISDHRKIMKGIGHRKITQEQIDKLNNIGMVWDIMQYQWDCMYQKAKEYYNIHGNLEVKGKDNRQLYQWLNRQQEMYLNEKLTEENKEKLVLLEFDKQIKKNLELKEAKSQEKNKVKKTKTEIKWDSMYNEAKQYYDTYQNLRVVNNEEYKKLHLWIKTQRRKYKEESLTEEQIKKLETIGMMWDVIEYQWNCMFDQAKEYYEKYGSLSMPDERVEQYKKLNVWLLEQKRKYNNEDEANLTEEQIKKLESIGIVWNFSQAVYDKNFEQAKQYYEEHGNLVVPRVEEYQNLTIWIKSMRKKYKESKLTESEIERLESIGMIWDAKQYRWDCMCQQAKEYYEEHGNLSIPQNRQDLKQLRQWITNRKHSYRDKSTCKLSEKQIEQLQELNILPKDSITIENNNLNKIQLQKDILVTLKNILLECKNQNMSETDNIKVLTK